MNHDDMLVRQFDSSRSFKLRVRFSQECHSGVASRLYSQQMTKVPPLPATDYIGKCFSVIPHIFMTLSFHDNLGNFLVRFMNCVIGHEQNTFREIYEMNV